jgi:hypothetical protein
LLTVKYPKQGRFCLGIGIVDRGDGPKGERIELFDYTSKNIITIKTKNEMIESSIREVKKLPLDSKDWTSSNHEPGALYLNDPVTKIDGVSVKKQELLAKAGITLIQDLVGLDDAEIKRIAKSTKGLGVAGLAAVVDASRNVLNESAPETTYYIEAENPWAAKYGTEKDEWGVEAWEVQLKKTSAFSGVACITDLVQWIASKSRDFYAGTEREDDWHFYHDALSQLTAAETIKWMKATTIPGMERSIYECWIKPELDLNIDFGCYHGRPLGNTAELMPLDNSCNNDVHESGRLHVVCSRSGVEYTSKDKRLFSFATPKHVSYVYRRIFHPETGVAPRPERIVQDVHKAIRAMRVIMEAKGAYVPGLAGGRIPGGRHVQTEEKTSSNWGGRREKIDVKDHLDKEGMHADLKSLLDDPERNVTNMFALRDYFDVDEDSL